MICNWCREKRHDSCVNNWKLDPVDPEKAAMIERDEPIKSCACQHRPTWNFAKSGDTEEIEGNNGDGS